MKCNKVITIAGLVSFALLIASTASASVLVTNFVDGSGSLPISGNQAWTGQLGDDFTTTQTIVINAIGVFDDDGDGTVGDLVWQLFNVQTGALIHKEIVSATGVRTPGSTIQDNYVFKTLAAPILLEANQTYSAVAYGFDNDDKNFNTNFGLNNLDVEFNTLGLTAAGGRYSLSASDLLPTIGPGNVNSASDMAYNFGAASFDYAVVPEPASIAVWGLLSIVGIGLIQRRRMRK